MTLLKFPTAVAERELTEMLSVRRAANSKTERKFIATYIDTLPGVERDGYGNRIVTIGGAKAPPVLWTAHTDSVHSQGGTQHTMRDGDMLRLHKHEKQSNCLGADDGTGVWLLRNMILRGVKGSYVFFREEESGGRGSNWMVENHAEWLSEFQVAIALDRKGYSSVITHQGSRCASDTFARSLAAQLGGDYVPDSTGIFTDTANMTHLIPECSNLSIGYGGAHCSNEAQNIPFAIELLDKLCELDVSKLTVERDPTKVEEVYDVRSKWSDYYGDYNGQELWDDVAYGYDTPSYSKSSHAEFHQILRIVELYPDEVADYLEQSGITAEDLRRALGIKQERKWRW